MLTWLKALLYDEAAFLAVARLGVILLGEGFRAGLVPTGVDNGGAAIGPYVSLLAAFVSRRST